MILKSILLRRKNRKCIRLCLVVSSSASAYYGVSSYCYMIAPSRSPLDGGDRSRYGVNPSHSKVWLGDFPRYCPAFSASSLMTLQRGVHRYSRFCFWNRFQNGQLPYPTRNYAVRSFQRSTISSPSSSFCKLGLGRSVWYLRVFVRFTERAIPHAKAP